MNINKTMGNFLSEDNGHFSSMRLIVMLIVVVVLFNWTWHNITTGTLTSFDWQDLMVVIGPLIAKAWQKGKEGKNESSQNIT